MSADAAERWRAAGAGGRRAAVGVRRAACVGRRRRSAAAVGVGRSAAAPAAALALAAIQRADCRGSPKPYGWHLRVFSLNMTTN
jgi:hypothetical protein